ncbi:hypothetical protein BG58_35870 [Caballeronia jiangsuensis]|nr:hypothetical protein BG58_35870 [Caballeronia jiangsuensis]
MEDADEAPIKLASLMLLDRVAFDSSRSESLNHRNVKLGRPRASCITEPLTAWRLSQSSQVFCATILI